MILGHKSFAILGSGITGWFVANANLIFSFIEDSSATISTYLGLMILVITMITAFFNVRTKYFEYRKAKEEFRQHKSRDPP